jgi:hypothetical protein
MIVTEDIALHAVIVTTGIPAELLVMDPQSYDDCYIYVSSFSKKKYYVECTQKVENYSPDEMKDMKIIGEHQSLSVYEMNPWWNGLL